MPGRGRTASRLTLKGYGGTVLEQFRSRLASGWPSGLTVLVGKDLYHMDTVQAELLKALVPPGSTDFSLTVYGEDKVDVASVVAAARSLGMFSPQRVILVRELSALEGEPEALSEYGRQPPEGSFLIVRAPDMDKRRKLHKALFACGHTLEFGLVSRSDDSRFKDDVRKMAAERNMTLSREVGAFLMETSQGSLYRVIGELDKIRDWFGGEGKVKVGLDDARKVLSGTELLDGWEVANAILDRDEAAGVVAVRKLVDSGGNSIQLLGGIAYRTRTMLQARAMLEQGRSRQEIVSATRAFYIRDSLFQGIERYSFPEILAFPALLGKADKALKSSTVDPGLILEQLVRDLIARAA
jgi:DNA polymerase-3 subunit delta